MKFSANVAAVTLTAVIGISGVASAQTVQYVSVGKGIEYVQTSSATVIVDPTPAGPLYGGPYDFHAQVGGANVNLLSAPRIAGPISVNATFYNSGFLVYSPDDSAWRMGPNANDWGSPTLANLNANFGSGNYTFSIAGNSLTLNLSGDAYPNAPKVTLSGGAWQSGAYVLNPSSALSITTSAFVAYGTHPRDKIGLFIDGIFSASQFSTSAATNTLSYTVPANTFVAGSSYFLGAAFVADVDLKTVSWLPGSTNTADYYAFTGIQIGAVPEVSSSTMVLSGLLVFVGLRSHRRKVAVRRGEKMNAYLFSIEA